MDANADVYYNEGIGEASTTKGFTKSFVKRTKDKKVENVQVVELLTLVKEGRAVFGSRVAEKCLKRGTCEKIFVSTNCDDFALRKINHYGKLSGIEVVLLDLDNHELSQKLSKPFLISMVCVRKMEK